MERLELDTRGIPTGRRTAFPPFAGALDDLVFDDGFASPEPPRIAVSGETRRVEVKLGPGFSFAQVFAPRSPEVVALEPMTAPANALVSGDGLRLVEPGSRFTASYRIGVTQVGG